MRNVLFRCSLFMACVSFGLLAQASMVLAGGEATVNINPNLPGPNPSDNPAGLVANAYQFALLMGGVLAFGAIVYGAIRYTVSAGNPSGQAEGKEWVKGALWGLLLLAGATLILNTLNPSIAELRLPTLKPLEAPKARPDIAVVGGCKSGGCVPISGAGLTCKSAASCTADSAMLAVLKCVVSRGGLGLRITEAMPPTVPHISKCHNNGCCVDLTVRAVSGCNDVLAVVNAAKQCGLSVANEYLSCGGKKFDTATGDNIHIQGC